MTQRYTGGCQCGALRYEITEEPIVLYLCHCSECQTQSGSAFGMSLTVPHSGFRMTSGKPKTWRRSSASGRTVECAFCPDCGSRIYHQPERVGDTLNIKPGTLDDTSWLDPAGELWTDSAQPWIRFDDGRIRMATQPNDFTQIRDAWRRKRQS
ncbi:MAG: GFA family protein [Pseudomonadota bacterium]